MKKEGMKETLVREENLNKYGNEYRLQKKRKREKEKKRKREKRKEKREEKERKKRKEPK